MTPRDRSYAVEATTTEAERFTGVRFIDARRRRRGPRRQRGSHGSRLHKHAHTDIHEHVVAHKHAEPPTRGFGLVARNALITEANVAGRGSAGVSRVVRETQRARGGTVLAAAQ